MRSSGALASANFTRTSFTKPKRGIALRAMRRKAQSVARVSNPFELGDARANAHAKISSKKVVASSIG